MPGEKAVCVLLPNDSSVKGTIHFEQVSGECFRFTENSGCQGSVLLQFAIS